MRFERGSSPDLVGAPAREIAGVESDTDEIGGNEAKLSRPDADKANDQAIYRRYDPAMPELFSD